MLNFEDFETNLLFEQLSLEDEQTILEANINTKDISAPHKGKGNYRYIMITGSGISSHNGRMKVSKPGIKITRSTSYEDYISIYRSNDNTIVYEGDLKEIKMTDSEYQYYINLFLRNEVLIQIVKAGNGKYDPYVDKAFTDDEKARLRGLIVNRKANGDVEAYKSDSTLEYRRNIRGEDI